jgi:hypothetical protein
MSITNFSQVEVNKGSATSTAAAATINKQVGLVTTEALATAAGSTYTFTLTNGAIKATSLVFVTVAKGTATTGEPVVQFVTPAAGSAVVLIRNVSAAAALNGTIKIGFLVLDQNNVA